MAHSSDRNRTQEGEAKLPTLKLSVPDSIGGRVRAVRIGAGYTQRELALRAGVTAGYISRLEAGDNEDPSWPALEKLAKALDVSAYYLADGKGAMVLAYSPSDAREIGQWVRNVRRLRGLTQMGLARRAGLSQSWLSHLERGENARPWVVPLKAVAKALDVPLSDLVTNGCLPGEGDLSQELREGFRVLPLDLRELIGELVAEGCHLSDSSQDHAAFAQAIRSAVASLKSVQTEQARKPRES